MADRFAAMVPLAYGVRTENLVVYFSDDWEDLVDLLEAPLEFLRGQQFQWQMGDSRGAGWQLLSPVNAVIECGYHNPQCLLESISLLGPAYFGLGNQKRGAMTVAAALVNAVLHKLARGAFFVEFATYTNNIQITYYPPLTGIVNGRYTGGITDATLMSAKGPSASFNSVHFDLLENSHLMRAQYIVNYLERSADLIGQLNAEAQSGKLLGDDFTMLPARPRANRLRFPAPGPLHPRPGPIFFEPAPLGQLLAPGQQYEALRRYPRMIVSNLSDPIESFVCSTAKCPIGTQTPPTYQITTMLVESYARALYDPCFVMGRCADRGDKGGRDYAQAATPAPPTAKTGKKAKEAAPKRKAAGKR